jgi:hypothetical protein
LRSRRISFFQETQQQTYQVNPNACGNAWFIDEIKFVPNADSEMNALSAFEPKKTVVVDERFKSDIGEFIPSKDSSASIKLTKYAPMQLDFESNASTDQFAVFSADYYTKGGNVYIDGVKSNYIRANYLLRAMKIPAGKHQIVFKFEPVAYSTGEKISLASSLLLVLLIGFASYKAIKEYIYN